MVLHDTLEIRTDAKIGVYDITGLLEKWVRLRLLLEGQLLVFGVTPSYQRIHIAKPIVCHNNSGTQPFRSQHECKLPKETVNKLTVDKNTK